MRRSVGWAPTPFNERVLLPLWVMLGHNALYLLVGFLCLFAMRHGEDEEHEERTVREFFSRDLCCFCHLAGGTIRLQ